MTDMTDVASVLVRVGVRTEALPVRPDRRAVGVDRGDGAAALAWAPSDLFAAPDRGCDPVSEPHRMLVAATPT